MKRVLCCLLSILMLLQLPVAMSAGAASVATVLYEDGFDYNSFYGLYDSTNTWQAEYKISTTDNYGAIDATAPEIEDGVLKFTKGDSLRLNWTQLYGFSEFDAAKTYTLSFDVKVTDFGTGTNSFSGNSNSNREFYFAPGGYANQIEMRNSNHSNLGIRAGDTWNKDLTAYTLNTVYSCTIVWEP